MPRVPKLAQGFAQPQTDYVWDSDRCTSRDPQEDSCLAGHWCSCSRLLRQDCSCANRTVFREPVGLHLNVREALTCVPVWHTHYVRHWPWLSKAARDPTVFGGWQFLGQPQRGPADVECSLTIDAKSVHQFLKRHP